MDWPPNMTIYPGSFLPANATHHVCTTHPIPTGDQKESVCSQCGTKIYFSDEVPARLKKICVECYQHILEKDPQVESVGNVNSITKAHLAHKRN